MGVNPLSETRKIPLSLAARSLLMTTEGLRRLCLRRGLGRRNEKGHWTLSVEEVNEISRARQLIWGVK